MATALAMFARVLKFSVLLPISSPLRASVTLAALPHPCAAPSPEEEALALATIASSGPGAAPFCLPGLVSSAGALEVSPSRLSVLAGPAVGPTNASASEFGAAGRSPVEAAPAVGL
jgi:hypothetical protein